MSNKSISSMTVSEIKAHLAEREAESLPLVRKADRLAVKLAALDTKIRSLKALVSQRGDLTKEFNATVDDIRSGGFEYSVQQAAGLAKRKQVSPLVGVSNQIREILAESPGKSFSARDIFSILVNRKFCAASNTRQAMAAIANAFVEFNRSGVVKRTSTGQYTAGHYLIMATHALPAASDEEKSGLYRVQSNSANEVKPKTKMEIFAEDVTRALSRPGSLGKTFGIKDIRRSMHEIGSSVANQNTYTYTATLARSGVLRRTAPGRYSLPS